MTAPAITGPGHRIHRPGSGWFSYDGWTTLDQAATFARRSDAMTAIGLESELAGDRFVAVVGPGRDIRPWLEPVYRRCGKMLRDGRCMMDPDHRGRCSSAVHWCDSCGKARRGAHAFAHGPDGGDDETGQGLGFCFFCTVVAERQEFGLEVWT